MLPLDASTIERDARWLRDAGHSFSASLLEALYRDAADRAGECRLMLDIDAERFTVLRVARNTNEKSVYGGNGTSVSSC